MSCGKNIGLSVKSGGLYLKKGKRGDLIVLSDGI